MHREILTVCMCIEDARQVILSGEITNELIELLRAYNDEPDSSQWLRGWSDYGDLLEDTLKQLMKHGATFLHYFWSAADVYAHRGCTGDCQRSEEPVSDKADAVQPTPI